MDTQLDKAIHELRSQDDATLVVSKLTNNRILVRGYRKQPLDVVVDKFNDLGYDVMLNYGGLNPDTGPLLPAPLEHLRSTASIVLELHGQLESPVVPALFDGDHLKQLGRGLLTEADAYRLEMQQARDAPAIFEFLGRVLTYYPSAANWPVRWGKPSGNMLRIHVYPGNLMNPVYLLNVQDECVVATVHEITLFPRHIEVVFRMQTDLYRPPRNRRRFIGKAARPQSCHRSVSFL